MRFQQALQVQLQERYRRIFKSEQQSYGKQLRWARDWMLDVSALRSALATISRSAPGFDPQAWFEAVSHRGNYDLPDTEVEFDKLVWWLINHIADEEADKAWRVATKFSHKRNMNDNLRDFTEAFLEPFVEHLQARLSSSGDVLYLLERYRRQVGWFEAADLYDRYQADTSRGEALYDRHLRRFLFEQGIDYPFSQPASPAGKADVVTDPGSDNPLTCEIKLFDNDRYPSSFLAKGLTQAIRYAEDYGHTDAYLVIFN